MILLKLFYAIFSLVTAVSLVCMLFSHMLESGNFFRTGIAIMAAGSAVGFLSLFTPGFHPPIWILLQAAGLCLVVVMMRYRQIQNGTGGEAFCQVPPIVKEWLARLRAH